MIIYIVAIISFVLGFLAGFGVFYYYINRKIKESLKGFENFEKIFKELEKLRK